MKIRINIDKNLVEFTPENSEETAKLQQLWRLMVDCARFNKKMVPIGENTFPNKVRSPDLRLKVWKQRGPLAILRRMLRKTAVVLLPDLQQVR